jgi:hypothetical protein
MEQYYKASGNFAPLSFILWLAVAIIALPILAVIYAYAIWYIPIPYLNFFITGIFGLLIGFLVSNFVIRIGKVRNGKLALVFALFAALTALYIHWAVWVDLAFNITGTVGGDRIGVATSNIKIMEVVALITNPADLFGKMDLINMIGVWGIKGGTVKGGFLTFIWVIEVIMVTVIATLSASSQALKPFCEQDDSWYDENELTPKAAFQDAPAFVKAMSSGDMKVLDELLKPAGDIKTEHHSKFKLFDSKNGDNFVSVTNEIAKTTDKGELKFESQNITSFLKISQAVADRLKVTG